MSRKIRVGVIYGGRTGEHMVSVNSADSLVSSLDRTKYDVVPIGISREGKWHVAAEPSRYLEGGLTARTLLASGEGGSRPGPAATAKGNGTPRSDLVVTDVVGEALDVAIPLVHGTYGEDGTLQGLLEMAGVPYVGAGVLSSAIGMDKIVMKKVLSASGLPAARWIGFRGGELRGDAARTRACERIAAELGFPCFVKPANGGSSVGLSRVVSAEELPAALEAALAFDTRVIVEEGIDCREIECSVIGNHEPEVSVPGEICYSSAHYDYETKYTPGKMRLEVPAPLDEELTGRVRKMAGEAYVALEVEGMARVDLFLERGTGRLLVNELNTIPGFTATSVFARLWEASGISYGALLDRLIDLAIERARERRELKGLQAD